MDKPITDDTFIMGYKVGARLCGTLRDAEKAIIQEAGSSWEPLYRRNHVAEETIKRLKEQNAALLAALRTNASMLQAACMVIKDDDARHMALEAVKDARAAIAAAEVSRG